MTDIKNILKLFDNWNVVKKKIDFKKKVFYPKHREIWNINLWKNIWFENDWKWDLFTRPVLVLKQIWSLYLVVAMSTVEKENKFYFEIDYKYFNKKSFIILSQFRTIDKRRFINKKAKLNINDFEEIKKRVKLLF